jgi:fibronectin-binding autotransporter adhesin
VRCPNVARTPSSSARRIPHLAAVAGVALVATAAAAMPAVGGLTQPPGRAGCVSEDGSGPCVDGHGLTGGVDAVAVSLDGKSVYATTHAGVARLRRSYESGAITQPAGKSGCVSETGSGGCANGHGISNAGADSVAVSPDGRDVYAASYTSSSVIRFKRNRQTGAIAQPAGKAGCVSDDGSGPCADGHALRGVAWVAVSADGKSVYAVSTIANAVVRFKRNKHTGAITQPAGKGGCVSDDGSGPCADGHALLDPVWVAPSPDGKSAYVASLKSNAVARFARNRDTGALHQSAGKAGCISEGGAGACSFGHGLSGPFSLAVARRSVYVASSGSNALVRLRRDVTSGAVSQPAGRAGCVSEDGSGRCADGHALAGANAVALSADGKSVYVSSAKSLVRFRRDTATGAVAEPPGAAGCVSDDGSGPCGDGHALAGAYETAVSADGRSVYVASLDDAAIVRLNRQVPR